jgi:hypothetical protein
MPEIYPPTPPNGNYINVDGVDLLVKTAKLNATGSAQTVVSAVTGKKIRVVALVLTMSAAGTVLWKSSTTSTIQDAMPFAANGGMDANRMPHGFLFETVATEDLKVTVSAGTCTGLLNYVEV